MSVCQTFSVAFNGITPEVVSVQVQITSGLPSFAVVGLADRAVSESRERVRGALAALGITLPPSRVVVSLSPADLPKVGNHFDLAIAMALLGALDILPTPALSRCLVMGELDLMGQVGKVSGVLPTAVHAMKHGQWLICPADNRHELAWVHQVLPVVPVSNLATLIDHCQQLAAQSLASFADLSLAKEEGSATPLPQPEDTAHQPRTWGIIRGQHSAKRAVSVAAAGGHHILLRGPPGVGKTMLAQAMTELLPPLHPDQLMELAAVYSLTGGQGLDGCRRPFRDPHHHASMAALVGGGSRAMPGEVSLAHHGVLFLDELPEFDRRTLDALRQPLESGSVTIARARAHVTYPARFQLVAAMNPCRCAVNDDMGQGCHYGPECARKYQGRISGALLDRIDLFIDVPRLEMDEISAPVDKEQATKVTAMAYDCVCRARDIQYHRYDGQHTNASVAHHVLEESVNLHDDARQVLAQASQAMRLSGRGYYRVLRVAQTLADLQDITAKSPAICANNVREALAYRQQHLSS